MAEQEKKPTNIELLYQLVKGVPFFKGANKAADEAGYQYMQAAMSQNPKEALANLLSLQHQVASESPIIQTDPLSKGLPKIEQPQETPIPQSTKNNPSPSQSQPQGMDALSRLLVSFGSGLAAAGGQPGVGGGLLDLIAAQQKSVGTKGVYGFDPVKGTVSLQAEVPANADVRNMQATSGIETLPPEERPIARSLARRLYGVKGAEKGVEDIIAARQTGKGYDQIEDSIRMASQSPEFSNGIRDAAQSLSVGKSDTIRNSDFDALDDYIQRGDMGGAKDYLKEMARSSSTADIQTQIRGKERSVEFLEEIRGDLQKLEDAGIGTNWISGNVENLMARVGMVKNPEMRKVATKIAIAVMNYRRSMTGVQFSYPENKEYFRLFPNINKIQNFNTAAINGLQEVFSGDLKNFYSQRMGKQNYNKIFGVEETQTKQQLPPGYSSNEWEIVQ